MRHVLLSLCSLALMAVPATAQVPTDHYAEWPSRRVVTTPAACLRHDELVRHLRDLAGRHPGVARLEEVGRSAENRPIHLLSVGRGPTRVLLWSQMHGDEPSATPALLDLAHDLVSRAGDADAALVLERLTLLILPMLNPDGTEHYDRRNAQGIDVNRDALNLATPEGRLLKEIRDRHQPALGFNLHDQDRRTLAGEGGGLATISLLAVAGDEAGTVTEGRQRAKRVASALVAALAPLTGGTSIARYDEDWSPRAFGDNLTAWGTPVVLVESGGLPPGTPLTELTRLNYAGLHAALLALARDDAVSFDPAAYEALPRNVTDAFADVVVRGGVLAQGPGTYRADVAFNVDVSDADRFGCAARPAETPASRIFEIGDARFLAAGRVVDASGLLVAPGLVASVEAGGDWLRPEVLETLASMGVTRLWWHVADDGRAAAERRAEALRSAARPEIVVKGLDDPRAPLVLGGPPRTPVSRRLTDVLDALAPGASAGSLVPAGERLPLATGRPASLLLLRPDPAAPTDPGRATVDGVFVDGRDTGAPRLR